MHFEDKETIQTSEIKTSDCAFSLYRRQELNTVLPGQRPNLGFQASKVEMNNMKGKSKHDSAFRDSEFKERELTFGIYRI